MKQKIIILTPVYKDWESLLKLLDKINIIFKTDIRSKFDLVIVDDNSNEKVNFSNFKKETINRLKILKLEKNLGSQRAIAIGLRFIQKTYIENYYTIVMDSDGQDNPDGIIEMIKKINSQNVNTIVAQRGQRKEPLWFRFFYEIYCFTIMIFTLKKIRYGNFCLINYKDVNKILLNNDIWNAFPPVISVSLKTFDYITLDREERYAGASKMSFFGLIQHALRVFSVLRVRVLIMSIIYIFGIYYMFENQYLIFLLFFLMIIFIFNFVNFFLSINCKKRFKKNYSIFKLLEH